MGPSEDEEDEDLEDELDDDDDDDDDDDAYAFFCLFGDGCLSSMASCFTWKVLRRFQKNRLALRKQQQQQQQQ